MSREILIQTDGDHWLREVRFKDCKWWDYKLIPEGPMVKLTNNIRNEKDLTDLFKDSANPPPYIFGFIYDEGYKRKVIFADGYDHNMLLKAADETAEIDHWFPPEGTVLILAQLGVERGKINKIGLGASHVKDDKRRRLALNELLSLIDKDVFDPAGVAISTYVSESDKKSHFLYNPITGLVSSVG